MEKFETLPAEKQNLITEAALSVFGSKGYRKASMGDIAAAAGVSKPALFHYFGTKKDFYLYLAHTCANLLLDEIKEVLTREITDFFEKIIISAKVKMSCVRRYPSILIFFESVYFERDTEVFTEIQAFLAEGMKYRTQIAEQNVDTFKFKDGIDPVLVMKTLTWMAEGYASMLKNNASLSMDTLIDEFMQCLDLMKNNFYKEEYLV